MPRDLDGLLSSSHVICVCEGAAEEVIIEKLFSENLLSFKSSDRSQGNKLVREFTRKRSGKQIEAQFLQRDYGNDPIIILRVLDSRNENFNLSPIYQERVENGEIQIINILTRPEIEMLIILNEGNYEKYSKVKSQIKASDYCKSELELGNVKSKRFVNSYFEDTADLVKSLKMYKKNQPNRQEFCLYDLLAEKI